MASTDRDYEASVHALNSLQSNSAVLDQQRKNGGRDLTRALPEIRTYLRRLKIEDDDLKKLRAVHIAGTKGKGSTSAMVASILKHSGQKTGLYSSPHILEVRERIRINSEPVSKEMFSKYFWMCWDLLKENPNMDKSVTDMPQYFRFLTCMAFKVFLEEKVDVAVLEVGIGGRYDATNIVVSPVVCGITPLGFDHMSLLGNTISEIAYHKSGIIKAGVPVYTALQPDAALEVIANCANEAEATITGIAPRFADIAKATPEPITVGLAGAHQKENAALAAVLAKEWLCQCSDSIESPISLAHPEGSTLGTVEPFALSTVIREGIATCFWPGRSQIIENGMIKFYFDGCHTPESNKACAEWYSEEIRSDPSQRRVFLFNCGGNRDPGELLKPFLQLHKKNPFSAVVFTSNQGSRSSAGSADQTNKMVSEEELYAQPRNSQKSWTALTQHDDVPSCTIITTPTIEDAVGSLERIQLEHPERKLDVLVAGSLHLVGGVMYQLKCHVK